MAHPRRPDPARGVFETLLVLDGRPVELEGHLARLDSSLAELFPGRPAPDLEEVDLPVEGVMRIDVVPCDGRLKAEISLRAIEQRSGVAALRSLTLAGGLGAHKWADRSLLEEAQARFPDDAVPLIADRDGAVLEASRANLFAVRDGALFTPPLDGRILPGITRARVLDLAGAAGLEAHEAMFRRDDLFGADEVFLTGSVRGIEPVASLDGTPLAGPGPVASELAAALRRAWLGAPVA